MTTRFSFTLLLCTLLPAALFGQHGYWQQHATYQMDVRLDVQTHRFVGRQLLTYTNNSPDTLTRAFYHLYFNAFQPGSMMDVRSRTIADPDRRVSDRIFRLKPEEIGYQKIKSLRQNGKVLTYQELETILEVTLAEPILPGGKAVFEMEFEGQVPLQIRRSGRDSAEGISYSMVQWFPKLCEYDADGWHPNPYIGREFYGVWGDFDVRLTLDRNYVVAATGVLQNPEQIGHGYDTKGKNLAVPNTPELTWHFKAENVHDFAWAADPDYKHVIYQMPNGPELHFFYQPGTQTATWEQLPEYTAKAFAYMNQHFGVYPYPVYNVVQGGDGGMEYAMLTLITGNRPLRSLVGVTVHELIHSWYQMVLGFNESLYAWMDEGFTSYASEKVMHHLFDPDQLFSNLHDGSYRAYRSLVESGNEEPLTTHADHFNTNSAYSIAAYSKGAIFLHQLSYVIGESALKRTMRRFYDTWKFKHPTADHFIRIAEKESGMVLDWYKEYWVNGTKTIDYSIKTVVGDDKQTKVTLERIGLMPMPVELEVQYKNGQKEIFYMPMVLMRGQKTAEQTDVRWSPQPAWPWTDTEYTLNIPAAPAQIERLTIDPSRRMADVQPQNNSIRMSQYLKNQK